MVLLLGDFFLGSSTTIVACQSYTHIVHYVKVVPSGTEERIYRFSDFIV